MEKKRSVGVTIFAIFFMILGLWNISWLIKLSLSGRDIWNHPFTGGIEGIKMLFKYGYLLDSVFMWMMFPGRTLMYILLSVASVGIYRSQYWAVRMVITLSSLIVLFYIFFLLRGINAVCSVGSINAKEITIDSMFIIFIITFFSYTIYFFARPKVKAQFSAGNGFAQGAK